MNFHANVATALETLGDEQADYMQLQLPLLHTHTHTHAHRWNGAATFQRL